MMKKVKKGSAIVALLALVLSTVVIPKAYAAVEVDTEAKCSIKFNLDDVKFEEMRTLPIDVNLYKVADIDKVGNYTAEEGYTLGNIDDTTIADEWLSMAEAAYEVAQEKTATAESTVLEGFTGLETGLYLVAAETAQSSAYEYSFKPYLISLPNNYYASKHNDTWVYDITTSLKPERADRYGDLVIEKELKSFNATVGGATFIFQVDAVKDYKLGLSGKEELKTVYSDVVALAFDEAGKLSTTIEKIPAGAVVTVKEIYSGGSYTVTGSDEFETVIIADEAATVTFVNDYDGSLNGGTCIVNHFEEVNGGWEKVDSPEAE